MANSPCVADEPRAYRAIFFDLDGTLLPMDLDEFLNAYFARLIGFAAAHGCDPQLFKKALMTGTHAMIQQDGVRNEQAFWQTFATVYGLDDQACAQAQEVFAEFYQTDFCRVGDTVTPNPATRKALDLLSQKGYPLVLATMPLFPRMAVEERLRWAGAQGVPFVYLTTYENSTSAKPKLAYYQEILDALGLQASEVLMVGNNTQEDLVAMELGLDAFLITDWLLDPIAYDKTQVKHGSMEDFLAWVGTLPACAGQIQ